MTTRLASLLAAAALCVSAAPVLAQDWEYGVPPLPALDEADTGSWEDEWDDAREDDRAYDEADDDAPLASHDSDAWRDEHHEHASRYRDRQGHLQEPRSRFAYSPEQRADWLDRCRSNRSYSGDDRERGALIGGALGALGGGLAGNRIAGRGDRLEGTLLGAGAGAVAGAALGSAIDAESGRSRSDFCEDYLIQYEESAVGYGHYPHGVSPYGAAPVMWVRVPVMREKRDCGCAEVVEEEVDAPAPRARRVAPRPDKRVRYSK
jgi:hypothetical protein